MAAGGKCIIYIIIINQIVSVLTENGNHLLILNWFLIGMERAEGQKNVKESEIGGFAA
jgi:hypothetical protein